MIASSLMKERSEREITKLRQEINLNKTWSKEERASASVDSHRIRLK